MQELGASQKQWIDGDGPLSWWGVFSALLEGGSVHEGRANEYVTKACSNVTRINWRSTSGGLVPGSGRRCFVAEGGRASLRGGCAPSLLPVLVAPPSVQVVLKAGKAAKDFLHLLFLSALDGRRRHRRRSGSSGVVGLHAL
jgi:hypothetical protein